MTTKVAIRVKNDNVRNSQNGKLVKLNKEKQKLKIRNPIVHHFDKMYLKRIRKHFSIFYENFIGVFCGLREKQEFQTKVIVTEFVNVVIKKKLKSKTDLTL